MQTNQSANRILLCIKFSMNWRKKNGIENAIRVFIIISRGYVYGMLCTVQTSAAKRKKII